MKPVSSARIGRALVFGMGDKRKVKALEHLLAEYRLKITTVSEWADVVALFPGSHFDLMVVTDSINDNLNKDFLVCLRESYPHARILCLFDRMSQEVEIAMRSVGLVFFGSYKRFSKSFRDILESAVRPIFP